MPVFLKQITGFKEECVSTTCQPESFMNLQNTHMFFMRSPVHAILANTRKAVSIALRLAPILGICRKISASLATN
jgi:hypothetical protein